MYSYIIGKIVHTNGRSITLESNYHGYYVWVKDPNEFEVGKIKRIYVYKTLSKDFKEDLYGFLTWEEKMVFIDLLALQGIGPKTALQILSKVDINILRTAAANKDVQTLVNIPGISTKIAQQICSELSDKYPNFRGIKGSVMADVIETLQTLGYTINQINFGLKTIDDYERNVEDIVAEIIKNIAMVYND